MNLLLLVQTSPETPTNLSSGPLLRVAALALAALAVCWLLHLLAGGLRRRALRRLNLETAEAGFADRPSIRRLLIDWGARAGRTLLWVLYFVFLLNLLPEERDRISSVRETLLRVVHQADVFLVSRGIPAVIVAVITVFLMRFAAALIRTSFELYERRVTGEGAAIERRRLKTLSAIARGTAQAVILFVGLMVLLQQLGVSVAPILASAGIVGIAVGFGAQSLVKDIFAGFLILLEDQYNVGDSVKIGETTGTVEHLTLRVTLVRSLEGSLTTIPNGAITTVSNLSRDWSRAVLDVEIDYSEDVDRAMKVMIETARQMRAEKPDEITEEPVMYGVEKLTAAGVGLRLAVKTAPSKQAEIARELRRRTKLAFDREGIRAPSGPPPSALPQTQHNLTAPQGKP
ncbi:MAG TPA: mechanosensitive ion channel family protein [Blastocatellia bacterium]|nr:mechanosensitive ion channel family protein [Blastocatellia bacterium]